MFCLSLLINYMKESIRFPFDRPGITLSPWGAVAGIVVAYLSAWLMPPGIWLYLGICLAYLALSVGLYIGASFWYRRHRGELFRGAMIGMNAMVNALIIQWLFHETGLSVVAAVLLFMGAVLFVSRMPAYHFFLGWLNFLLPLSWPVNIPGGTMFVVNLIFSPLAKLHPSLHPLHMETEINLKTATFTSTGGLLRPFRGFSGLNMGNFIFLNPGAEHLQDHETGHLFSLASMGFAFHYIGGIDEAFYQTNRTEAYAEFLAESYSRSGAGLLGVWR